MQRTKKSAVFEYPLIVFIIAVLICFMACVTLNLKVENHYCFFLHEIELYCQEIIVIKLSISFQKFLETAVDSTMQIISNYRIYLKDRLQITDTHCQIYIFPLILLSYFLYKVAKWRRLNWCKGNMPRVSGTSVFISVKKFRFFCVLSS